ncbi:MAG: signal peptidase II [Candidatus Devosia phytovorans]|uniref:Lipoprotein signal peptidase n=1 Tax=Candidatus Devosia phytovorans TaxID=3121372 RepID=A0AAJ5VTE6_9HYPH|nr:signal peptidase II [Devosia sp.]WEK03138.1 MAG: signal peptidase II [Devosia sp.]
MTAGTDKAAAVRAWLQPSVYVSLTMAILAFGLDRAHKAFQVAGECIAVGAAPCVEIFSSFVPFSMTGWRGGEVVRVTDFFDYVLVWNTGISYGLFDSLPVWALGVVMLVAIVALSAWWVRADSPVVRLGLAFCIGGALSNAIDRLIYGAVADFFHLHWGSWSFYIFNVADVAITLGVILLIVDLLGLGKARKPASTS